LPKGIIVFDLDGTLVDSSGGIIASLMAAYEACSLIPAELPSAEIIGPPLRETLRLLSPSADEAQLDKLVYSFKTHYDSCGFRQTMSFPGIDEMIQALDRAKIPLHIATNKRKQPTSQILNLMGWSSIFDLVLSPDSVSPALSSKAAILSRLLAEASLGAQDCLYIGDRLDDYNAAREVGIPFALAEWGFEVDGSGFPSDAIRMKSPDAGQLISSFIDRDSHWPE